LPTLKLKPEIFNRIVSWLTPHTTDPRSRRTLIDLTFNVYETFLNGIDWAGNARDFTVNLIQHCLKYGEVERGKQALVLLLESVRHNVGVDKQLECDKLIVRILLQTGQLVEASALLTKAHQEWSGDEELEQLRRRINRIGDPITESRDYSPTKPPSHALLDRRLETVRQLGYKITAGVIIALLILVLAVTVTKNYELVASYLWPATPTLSPPVTDTPPLPTTVSITPTSLPSHTPTRPVKKTPIPTRTPTESPTSGPTPTPAPTATFAPVNVDPAALARARAGVSTNGEWTPHVEEIDGVEMVLVPAGCFMMGDADGESDEKPVHEICFDNPFLIDRYQVTNAQFASFDGQAHQDSRWPDDNRPRERITWFEARTFCNVRGGRLPTEAEWEYAAAGPESLKFSWGNDFVAENAVHEGNSDTQTAPVGSKPGGVSWVGALDVIGNVWEWTNSIDMAYPYDPADGRESGTATGVERVARGGSWNQDYAIALRTANRFTTEPNQTFLDFGVRCARDIGELP